MLIIGAGGFAKQLIEVFDQLGLLKEIVLFDDYSDPPEDKLYDLIPILHSDEEVKKRFATDDRFALGIGDPGKRARLAKRFLALGGKLETIISPKAYVSKINTKIKTGTTVLTSAIVENGVEIGEGVLINIGAFVTHDCRIGDYSEVSPGVRISGGCSIGSLCFLGTGSVLLPGIKIGDGAKVAAGSVVLENVPPNVLVAGVPATIKKTL